MLIEEKEVRVLTDPGTYTTAQNEIKNIDVILITHEHADHLHIESVKKIRENNPRVPVDVLALPVAGPWCKVKDSIDFALEIYPKVVFPVHDGQLNEKGLRSIYGGAVAVMLDRKDIKFLPLEIGKDTEI